VEVLEVFDKKRLRGTRLEMGDVYDSGRVSVDKRTSGSCSGPCEILTSEVSIGTRYSEMSLKDA
jgi:hypothetical protein